jgi:hypothetical protein
MARINSSDIILELAESVKDLGFEETVFLLKGARKEKEFEKRITTILSIICNNVNIEIEKISQHNLRDDRRKIAIGMCIYFCKKYYQYTYEEISKAMKLNLKFQILNRYHKLVKNAKMTNPKSEVDIIIAKHINIINSEIQKNIN